MKIAFCVISNRPERMLDFSASFRNAMVEGHQYSLCLSYQHPYTDFDLERIGEGLPRQVSFLAKGRKKFKDNSLFDYCGARLHSYSLDLEADYIISCDDDFRFTDGQSTNLYKWSSGERYMDCCKYLEQQKSCGIVLTKGFLGGVPSGRWILPMSGGFFETGTGIVIRGWERPYQDIIHPRLKVPGVGDDIAVSMTSMLHGYYVAKALNTTTLKDHTKKIIIKKGKSSKNFYKDQNYDLKMMNEKGVLAKAKKEFGEFRFGFGLPPTFVNIYRERAAANGFIVMF